MRSSNRSSNRSSKPEKSSIDVNHRFRSLKKSSNRNIKYNRTREPGQTSNQKMNPYVGTRMLTADARMGAKAGFKMRLEDTMFWRKKLQ